MDIPAITLLLKSQYILSISPSCLSSSSSHSTRTTVFVARYEKEARNLPVKVDRLKHPIKLKHVTVDPRHV